MPQNTVQTRKKFHNPKRNNHKSIMKGGAEATPQDELQKSQIEAKEELEEEKELLEFIGVKQDFDAIQTRIREVNLNDEGNNLQEAQNNIKKI